MKFLAVGLLALLVVLQYRLWLGDGGMRIIEAIGAAFDGYGDGWATAT